MKKLNEVKKKYLVALVARVTVAPQISKGQPYFTPYLSSPYEMSNHIGCSIIILWETVSDTCAPIASGTVSIGPSLSAPIGYISAFAGGGAGVNISINLLEVGGVLVTPDQSVAGIQSGYTDPSANLSNCFVPSMGCYTFGSNVRLRWNDYYTEIIP